MINTRIVVALALCVVPAGAAFAQQHQAQANNAVSNQYADRQQAIAAQNGANVAQYADDRAAYRAAVRSQHRDSARNARHYAHQQRAYADAMRAWRRQVWACKHGSHAACNAPSPDPAQFW